MGDRQEHNEWGKKFHCQRKINLDDDVVILIKILFGFPRAKKVFCL